MEEGEAGGLFFFCFTCNMAVLSDALGSLIEPVKCRLETTTAHDGCAAGARR